MSMTMPIKAAHESIEVAPPLTRHADDPRHWRDRAEEARAKAELMTDSVARSSMLQAVNCYERLADLARSRQRNKR